MSRYLTGLSVVTASALVLRLAGTFREYLPSAARLAALLAALHLLSLARRPGQLEAWRDFVRAR
ncbi:MAG: hypothetical protein EHM55_14085, partial [Acidobacteria bacterium]